MTSMQQGHIFLGKRKIKLNIKKKKNKYKDLGTLDLIQVKPKRGCIDKNRPSGSTTLIYSNKYSPGAIQRTRVRGNQVTKNMRGKHLPRTIKV